MAIEIEHGNIVEVDRGAGKNRMGQGLIKGLGVIWSHWSKSWTKKLEKMSDIDGIFTVQYPEERLVLPEAYRNMPILLYDDETGHELCTSCFQCERICPPQVIHMTQARHPETGKPLPAVTEFIIEYDACMSCGLCEEVCPFDSIKMDHVYELSTWDHPSLTVHKPGLMRPVSYYQAMKPDMWEQVKANAYKKLDGSKKRRVDTIGIAQAFLDNPQPAKAPTKAAAAPATTPAPAAPAAKPPAATGKSMSDEKKAKLEAIRAANAAKRGGDSGEASDAAPAQAAAETPTQAAPSGGAGTLPFGPDNVMGGVPANTKMKPETVEKLRSIREGNLKKRGLL
jgi:NADH-quinone oxidoreductase subunit I/electron transport complex protein RnfC